MTTELEGDLAALAATLQRSSVAVRSARGSGSGSGVIWTAGGTVVTNAHVAQTANVDVELPDGRRVAGRVERRDERRDLASIRVDAADLAPPPLRDPSDLRAGELVVAFGHPLGVPNVLSTGIVYAAHRPGGDRFVRSDVKLAPGNSGGALADAAGRVIGINSMIAGDMALSIPIDEVRRFMGEAQERPRLGVRLAPADVRGRRDAFAILAVEPGSAAERAGLLPGDVIFTRRPAHLRFEPSVNLLRGGTSVTVPLPPLHNEAAAAA
jgi:serine protease Do